MTESKSPIEGESALSDNIKYNADGQLAMDGVTFESIAEKFGTPTYVYSQSRVVNSYRAIRDAFAGVGKEMSIHYSLKANANGTIVKSLLKEGAGIDCVSAGEVYRALKCGCRAEDIVFAGVGKDLNELRFAVEKGVGWFNVENVEELKMLHEIGAALPAGTPGPQVALRINPDVEANTHPSIATGHGGAKFGMPMDVVVDLLKRKDEFTGVRMRGVHVHIGSQLGDTEKTVEAVRRVTEMIAPFTFVDAVNMGGGFPANYAGVALPSPKDFAQAVAPFLAKYHVMLEPGRSIVGEAGVLLTRVLYRKDQAGERMLIVDASMTDNMRPALYNANHGFVCTKKCSPFNVAPYVIVGPVCESTDVLSKRATLSEAAAAPGQLLAQLTAGAYCASMASTYNQRPLVPQIVIGEEGNVIVSRERQTLEDLLRGELDI